MSKMNNSTEHEQIATDFHFGDCQDRIVLPDGALAYVGEDHASGGPIAYRFRVCRDYGGNVLAKKRADESCVGISDFNEPTMIGHAGRVTSVTMSYIGSARDCTGRQIYRVEAAADSLAEADGIVTTKGTK